MKLNTRKILLILTMVMLLIPIQVAAENENLFQETIAPGVVRTKYAVKNGNSNAIANVLRVDLTNPNVKVNTVAGAGTYTNRATVAQMADRTNAVGLVNGDFFTMQLQGAPLGASIIDSRITSSPAVLTDIYSLGIDDTNTAHIMKTNFVGKVTAPNGATYNIDGLNKTFYWYQPNAEYSHEGKIQMYDDFWTSKSRGDKTAGEVLLNAENVVEQIQFRKNLDLAIPKGKKILQVSGASETFIRENVKVGDRLKISYHIAPNRNWKMMIGGHALLVENSQVKPYTKDVSSIGGVRARTAAGIADGGKTLFIVAVEGKKSTSAGMTLSQLSNFMLDLGCNTAINLDGGGSTAMSVRNLGDVNRTLVTKPETKSERKVVNGLGVYNISVNSGVIAGIKIKSSDQIVVGQTANISPSGAWDALLNPIALKDRPFTVTDSSNGANILTNNQYLALVPGQYQLNYQFANEHITKEITVLDSSAYEKLTLSSEQKTLVPGEKITLRISAKVKDKTITLSPKVFEYSLEGFQGQVNKDTGEVTVGEIQSTPKITVRNGEKSASLTFYDSNSRVISMFVNKKEYSLNGTPMQMDVAPFIKDSRTLIPLRFVAEAIGGNVDWNSELREVTIAYNGMTLQLPVGKKTMVVNGQPKEMDTAALVKNDRTFVPIRFVAEALGLSIGYDDKTREVTLVEQNRQNEGKENEVESVPQTSTNENNHQKNSQNSHNKENATNEKNKTNPHENTILNNGKSKNLMK